MGRDMKEIAIDGTSYRITQLGTKDARKVELRCARVLGELLPLALAGQHGIAGAARVGAEIARSLSDEDLELVVRLFAEQTLYSPGEGRWFPLWSHYDDHFAGANISHAKWLYESLRHTFADYFREAAPLLGAAVAAPSA